MNEAVSAVLQEPDLRKKREAQYHQEYRNKNADKLRAYFAAYRASNRDLIRAKNAAYVAANREAIYARRKPHQKAYDRKHYLKHRDKILAAARANPRGTSERKRVYGKRYYKANKERIGHQERLRYREKQAKLGKRVREPGDETNQHLKAQRAATRKAQIREYRKANIEAIRAHDRERKKNTRAQIDVRIKERKKSDPNFALRCRLHTRIAEALKCSGVKKSQGTISLIGCDIPFLREHLEAQFQPGMTWGNWSRVGWHIDHRRPCASFDLTDVEQQRECFHWSNLQPLWWQDNIRKGKKLPHELMVA